MSELVQFEPNASTFSIINAYYLAKVSAAAYAVDADFDTRIVELGLTSAGIIFPPAEVDDIRYFIGTTDQYSVLAFRGTVAADIHNWLTDADINQVSDPFVAGMVHKGFLDALNGEWPNLLTSIQALPPCRPLWITGHSLGAALATLASSWLAAKSISVQGVYTYGSPRVGSIAFYSHYKPNQYRFVNNNDIVPHVPLEVSLFGLHVFLYKHVGTLGYLNRQGQLGEGMSNWETKKAFILNQLSLLGGNWDQLIADHSLDRYINAIGSNLPQPLPTQTVPSGAIVPAPAPVVPAGAA
jgi:triacylglycerol lipase